MDAAEILNRACRRTGLATSGTERTDLLASLNDVYVNAILEAKLNIDRVDYTVVASTDKYAVSTVVASAPLGIYGMGRVTGGRYEAFEIVSHDELVENQIYSTAGDVLQVAPLGTKNLLFWPNPAVGDVIRTYYAPAVSALTDSGSSDPAAQVPVQFHQDVLLAGTILSGLDKDQRKEDVKFWGMRYDAGMMRLKKWADEFMGESTRMFVSSAGKRIVTRPDERRR